MHTALVLVSFAMFIGSVVVLIGYIWRSNRTGWGLGLGGALFLLNTWAPALAAAAETLVAGLIVLVQVVASFALLQAFRERA